MTTGTWIAVRPHGWWRVPQLSHEHQGLLTVKTRASGEYAATKGVVTVPLFRAEPDGWYVPRYFASRHPTLMPRHDRREPGSLPNRFRFLGSPRDYQIDTLGQIRQVLDGPVGMCRLLAPCGSGKTVMSLWTIAQRQLRTLVLVHSEFLLEQWVDRIQQYLGIPRDDLGFVRGKTMKRATADLSIATVQTVAQDVDRGVEFARHWDLVVVDEGHRAGAPVWCRMFQALDPVHWLVVSGNEGRADGLDDVLRWNVGPISARCRVEMEPVEVRRFRTGLYLDTYNEFRTSDMKIDRERLKYRLARDRGRTEKIAGIVRSIAARGYRTTIVMSDYLDHLRRIKEMAGVEGPYFCGKHPETGKKMKARTLVDSVKGVRTIYATYAMAREALDVAELDTGIMALPVMGVNQISGRLRRFCETKQPSVLVDVVDDSEATEMMWEARCRGYRKLGFEVKGWG